MGRMFGRATERAALDSAVAAARRGKGGSLLITGGPGAGKSELLDYVARSAGDAEIIRIEGLESESAIGLAGLHRLLLFHPNGRGVLPPLSVAPSMRAWASKGARTAATPKPPRSCSAWPC